MRYEALVVSALVAALVTGCVTRTAPAAHEPLGLGRTPTPDQIARWDIDVAPDGAGAPIGAGTAQDGESIYRTRCASCHGPNISLARWPYATTLFDYVRRAMPADQPQSLSPSEAYAVTAYLLYLNGLVRPHDVIDRDSIVGVQMPARSRYDLKP